MDRVPGFEPVGWGFDSLRGRQLKKLLKDFNFCDFILVRF